MRTRRACGLTHSLGPITAAISIVLCVPTAAAQPASVAEPVYNRFLVSFDPLGLLSDRYGLSFEAVFTPRDSVTAYPWFVYGESTGSPKLFGTDEAVVQTRALGLDVQYRRYVLFHRSELGARGLFVAPGLEAARYVTLTCVSYSRCTPTERHDWTYLGPSIDVGVQEVFRPGLTIGGSVGFRYRVVVGDDSEWVKQVEDKETPVGWRLSHGPGVGVRLRLWLGWAF